MTTKEARTGDIYACGWRLRMPWPLPATISWPGGGDGEPDALFTIGSVPESLADPVVTRSVLQIAADGTALALFPGIGSFLIEADRVTCDLEVDPDAPELVPVIFGNVLACICWRRRQLAFHGSAVAIDGKAIVLIGPVATGKSVLAAALARRGHVVLGDEVTAVRGSMAFPAGAPLQLADDALLAADIDPEHLPLYSNFPIPKRHWTARPAPEPGPYPVAAVLRLRKAEADAPPEPERLEGQEAVEAMLGQFYWTDMLDLLDSRAWAEREAAALAAAAGVHRLLVPRDLARVDEVVARIERIAVAS